MYPIPPPPQKKNPTETLLGALPTNMLYSLTVLVWTQGPSQPEALLGRTLPKVSRRPMFIRRLSAFSFFTGLDMFSYGPAYTMLMLHHAGRSFLLISPPRGDRLQGKLSQDKLSPAQGELSSVYALLTVEIRTRKPGLTFIFFRGDSVGDP